MTPKPKTRGRRGTVPKPIRMSEEAYTTGAEENGGVCLYCGEFTTGVEPDARNYLCPDCGEHQVFGLEEALVMGQLEFVEGDGHESS